MAKEMAQKIPGFGGGVFMFNNPSSDQAFNISNMIIDPDGRAYKRQGAGYQSRIPPLGKQVMSMFSWYRFGNPTQILAHGEDGHLYYSTDMVNWTDGGSGLSTTEPASFTVGYSAGGGSVTALNAPAVYIADGAKLWRWSGSVLLDITAALGSPPPPLPGIVPRYVLWWKDTLWVATGKNSPNPEYLCGSGAGNADTFPATTFVRIGTGDGDYITALFTASQELVVSKRRRTFMVVSASTLENRVSDYEKGCESHFSVAKFDAEVYYLTRFGVARYVKDAPAQIVSDNIQPLFSTIFLNLAQLERCHVYRVHHKIGWTLVRQGQTLPDFQIEYYPQYPRQPWTFHRMQAQTFVTLRDTQEKLYFAHTGPNDPRIYEAFQLAASTDDGTFFQGLIQSVWTDLGDPINRKYLRAIRLWGDGKFHVQVKKDRRDDAGQLMTADLNPPQPLWNDPGDKWDPNDEWGSKGSIGSDIVYPDQYGRQFSVLFFDLDDIPPTEGTPKPRRGVADLTYTHPRGWSILEATLELVQMGELG